MRHSILALALFLSLVAAAPGHAGETLSFKDVCSLVRVGTAPAEIVRLVREADRLELDPADLMALEKLGAHASILDAARKRLVGDGRVSVAWVIERCARGEPLAGLIRTILASGVRIAVTGEDRLRLGRAGVSKEVVDALEGNHVLPGFRAYTDPLGFVALQIPTAWRADVSFGDSGLTVSLSSPSAGGAPSELRVTYDVPAPGEAARLAGNAPERLGGVPASRTSHQYEQGDTSLREDTHRVRFGGLRFTVTRIGPVASFDRKDAPGRIALDTVRFFPSRREHPRRAAALNAAHVLDRYRDAVVMIHAEFPDGRTGTGSGFFVREDGYVLTNHHVICGCKRHDHCGHRRHMKLARKISVVWDSGASGGKKRRQVGARLVDTVYTTAPHADLALLRVPVGNRPYPYLPMTPVEGGELLKAGDPIAALGFPLPSRFGYGNLFVTAGAVARINRLDSGVAGQRVGTLDDLLTDATINPGNSGGPCVSLMTGGVIGLNTYIPLTLGKRLNYSGVCPIDHAIRHFPQLQWYPKGHRIGPREHTEYTAILLGLGRTRAAAREIEMALVDEMELPPTARSRLCLQRYRWHCQTRGHDPVALKLLETAIELHPKNAEAMACLARAQVADKAFGEAVRSCTLLVEMRPDDWRGLCFRAEVYAHAGRPEAALKDLRRAARLGADRHADFYLRTAEARAAAGDRRGARRVLNKGLEVAPRDFRLKIAIAKHLENTEKPDAALVEYGRILAAHADEPAVLEAYGAFLGRIPGRGQEAIKHMLNAAIVAIRRGEQPSVENLARAARSALGIGRRHETARIAAQVIHCYCPGQRATAHGLLARYCERKGWKTIAGAHRAAADRLSGRTTECATALSLGDVSTAVRIRYAPNVFGELLGATSLDFALTKANVKAMLKWKRWQVLAVLARMNADRSAATTALGKLIRVKSEGKLQSDARSFLGVYAFTNAGHVPLDALRVRLVYLDAKKNVLWSKTSPLRFKRKVIRSGETVRLRFRFNRWQTLAKAGVTKKSIVYVRLGVARARTALRPIASKKASSAFAHRSPSVIPATGWNR